ncbi:hypothetical protein CF326_g7605, partial [Tilletia indica]
PQKEQREP